MTNIHCYITPPPLPLITTPIPQLHSPDPKRQNFFVQIVKSFPTNISSGVAPLPPMPIAIDNGLPHITFALGTTTDCPTLCGLMDTCGALNTGYLPFHQWLMSEHLATVADYISFDDTNPFEPVKLGGAIRDPDNFNSSSHGNLTAVIRYYTPYTDTTGNPITISFALGNDVTVNTIFGLPLLCALDCTISLGSNSLQSNALNLILPITRAATRHGLPPNCLFDPASFRRNRVATLTSHPHPASSTSSTSSPASFVIEVPPKLWHPKPLNRYVPLDYSNDMDDGVFLFEKFGKAIIQTPLIFKNECTDIHTWDAGRDTAKFEKDFIIGSNVAADVCAEIISIIQQYWDCFYSEGIRKPILGFEFGINTGASPPVCCRKPHYGPHEGTIIMAHIKVLLHNGWIRLCGGPWGSSIVLAAKPHQEHITDIKDFIWRMCVSYRHLNTVTLPFQYPIPRCNDAIDNFGDSAGRLYFITLDNKTGYYQIWVRLTDQEKLAFFGPDHKKYTFQVMPFGPRNAPTFYTAMMGIFRDEWNDLYLHLFPSATAHFGSRVIINDILLWSTSLPALLNYFRGVCMVFTKYCVTFQLKKCAFITNRFEYVGHDITPDGNCPAEPRFDLINDWPLPASGQSLISFIGLLSFYNIYSPWFEVNVKPLRLLERQHHRLPIPSERWTMPLTVLWDELKLAVTSSPCLARFDASKPCFLKTDWSALGMGWILMQPDDSPASVAATATLLATGKCLT
jgi:hypothetical protein